MNNRRIKEPKEKSIQYKTVSVVNDIEIFYREAGNRSNPTVLLLHGYPSSSHMFRNLILALSDKFYVIAPDYPGFGFSSMPSPDIYEYSFDNLTKTMESFIEKLGLEKFTIYVQDYGGPIGFRIAERNPEKIAGFIIQNANAYEEGIGAAVHVLKIPHIGGDTDKLDDAIEYLTSFQGIKDQYVLDANESAIAPETYMLDYSLMQREGNIKIQSILFKNYWTNFLKYDEWHAYFRKFQPPALIVWGRNDKVFTANGAIAYTQDNPNAELHLLEGSHFLLEEQTQEMIQLIRDFLLNDKLQKENSYSN